MKSRDEKLTVDVLDAALRAATDRLDCRTALRSIVMRSDVGGR
jgi:hypothetical protein